MIFMVKILFGLFIFSRIIKMLGLLKKDTSSADETIARVEHIYNFTNIDFDALVRGIILIMELVIIVIVGATISLFAHPVYLLLIPAAMLVSELYGFMEFRSMSILRYLEFCKNVSKWRLFFTLLIELIWAAMVVMLL
jgi:hypothetical protein